MKIIAFLISSIFELLKVVTYKWILGIIFLVKRLYDLVKQILARRKLSHPEKNANNSKCNVIDHPAFRRPDPLIYSQKYLLQLGLPVTWDNPDIVLKRNGVIVTETSLLPNTDYEIDATIWNNSYDAPVVGLKVDFSYLNFGIGAAVNPIGSKIVNLGVKGGINHPAHAALNWRTPPVGGHYCLQVFFNCPGDANPANNIGQNNVDVLAPQSPVEFKFQLRNETKKQHQYGFETDIYKLPALQDCDEKKKTTKTNEQKWKEIQAIHNKNNYPIPQGWTVEFNPERVTLLPEEIENIKVKITPPDNFIGEQPFNVNAKTENNIYAGGVTLIVSKN